MHDANNELESHEYLAFRLGGEEYGIHILDIQEIRNVEPLTAIAGSAPYMKGVLNLRGVIVPVIDLRDYFELAEAVYDESTAVVILIINGKTIGMIVDGVTDVISIPSDVIKDAPSMGTTFSDDFIIGMGAINERMIIMVDIKRVLADPKLGLLPPIVG
jgi:purine-binding chemotaxis protein CheW